MKIRLIGRSIEKQIEGQVGASILEMARKNKIDWGYNCTRGTCARCRCIIEEGREHLNDVTDAEWERLDDDELDAGYRLGCQAVLQENGVVVARNKTYF